MSCCQTRKKRLPGVLQSVGAGALVLTLGLSIGCGKQSKGARTEGKGPSGGRSVERKQTPTPPRATSTPSAAARNTPAHSDRVQNEKTIRDSVLQVRRDMRSLATAIEAYYVDHNIYPAWGLTNRGPAGTMTYNYWLVTSRGAAQLPAGLPSFLMNDAGAGRGRFMTLTTPLPYVRQYPADLFAPVSDATFVYWSIFPGQPDPATTIGGIETPLGGVGWILVSPGPDGDYDIAAGWDVYNPAVAQPSKRLRGGTNRKGSAFTYDPTNGTKSDGDIWRVKQ